MSTAWFAQRTGILARVREGDYEHYSRSMLQLQQLSFQLHAAIRKELGLEDGIGWSAQTIPSQQVESV